MAISTLNDTTPSANGDPAANPAKAPENTLALPEDAIAIVPVRNLVLFPGAVLPTGHRIVSIEDTRVLVERNGSRSELNF